MKGGLEIMRISEAKYPHKLAPSTSCFIAKWVYKQRTHCAVKPEYALRCRSRIDSNIGEEMASQYNPAIHYCRGFRVKRSISIGNKGIAGLKQTAISTTERCQHSTAKQRNVNASIQFQVTPGFSHSRPFSRRQAQERTSKHQYICHCAPAKVPSAFHTVAAFATYPSGRQHL